jgi:DNA polymerase-3 subunit alpha
MPQFTHLHCHTQYSLLDGAAKISNLIAKSKQLGMSALAITDHGNMFGVPQFVSEARKQGIKPIIGCEFYVAMDMHNQTDKARYHQVILAKNKLGYQNLIKLCSLGYTEGYYYKPRVDKAAIKKYREGLIATTCCLGSEVCRSIIHNSEAVAEQCFLEWFDIFGEDYYIELQRHNIPEQKICNELLLKWSKKYNVPVIATNDVHYVNEKDSVAQDILLCLQTGKDYNDPNRMRFENNQFFLKSPEEMLSTFADVQESIHNTQQIVDKIETISLERDILMPVFQVPIEYASQYDYLEHLTYTGAKQRYGVLTTEIEARITYELSVIRSMGFEGYFLVVQDFILAAHKLQVAVGPGRGSVVGSIVAYCISITTVCPLQYNLIFERFLNPERVSMPDIDIDFDDIGRDRVIQYVVDKYGKNQVAQIITFGSMGAKSAIKDVARVLGLPLDKANYLAKLIPEKPGFSLSRSFKEIPELANVLKDLESSEAKILTLAETLEGSARHSGIHAAGIIIAPDDLTNYIPVKKDKGSELLVTQYDGSIVESVGMLKMDFLGLKSLSIIHDTLKLIEHNHNITIDLFNLPLNDVKTYELYQRGDTIGTFQFESDGMRQWLIKLHPTDIEDLIAMNALYRPGPMQFIPNFIARKHGREKIESIHPLLEEVVKTTYGIMVYQEQIIRAAQVMAGYTAGSADLLRKAMGKKIASEMERQRELFVAGANKHNNIEREEALKVFEVMEKFAQYGFNRSHSTAYAILAYQSAYLKANFPEEYMATLLTHNQGDIDKITLFIGDCKRQGIEVLGPDVNESGLNFHVTKNKQIRFGLAAIKGIGTSIAQSIINLRGESFIDFFDFIERVEGLNKKTLEALAMSGGLDCFAEYHRRQYVYSKEDTPSFIERSIKYLQQRKPSESSAQPSLFGDSSSMLTTIKRPEAPNISPYSSTEQLNLEKEMVGFYLSGHPLDKYIIDLANFCNCNSQNVFIISQKEIRIAGVITAVKRKSTKTGKAYVRFTIEDTYGSLELSLFGEDFQKHQSLLSVGLPIYIIGSVVASYGDEEAYELKINKIQALDNVRNQLCKKISLQLDITKIDKNMILTLDSLFSKYSGNIPTEIILVDYKDKICVVLSSPKRTLSLDNSLFDSFSKVGIIAQMQGKI